MFLCAATPQMQRAADNVPPACVCLKHVAELHLCELPLQPHGGISQTDWFIYWSLITHQWFWFRTGSEPSLDHLSVSETSASSAELRPTERHCPALPRPAPPCPALPRPLHLTSTSPPHLLTSSQVKHCLFLHTGLTHQTSLHSVTFLSLSLTSAIRLYVFTYISIFFMRKLKMS